MKNNLLKNIIICICLFFMYYILTNNKLINENIIFAINLWITKVFPSLFPMFIINELLIHLGLPNIISKTFKKAGIYIYIFILSIFSGTPSNAIIIKELYNTNKINSNDASYALSFTYFSNPIFIYTMLHNIFPTNTIIKIIIIHYISNIFIMLIYKNKLTKRTYLLDKEKNINVSNVINTAIKKSLNTLITILGTITFYIIISTIIINLFDFSDIINTLFKGFLEITQGLSSINNLNMSIKLKEIIAITIISFGGISIHSQIQNIVSNTTIQYKYFFIGRLIHTLISFILIFLF